MGREPNIHKHLRLYNMNGDQNKQIEGKGRKKYGEQSKLYLKNKKVSINILREIWKDYIHNIRSGAIKTSGKKSL